MSSDQQISVPSLTAIQVELFWSRHGKKVLLGSALVLLILVGIGGYLGYQAVRNTRAAKAFVGAHDIKGWEKVMSRYPGTIAGGNAGLQIAGAQAASNQFSESDKSYQAFIKDYSGHPLFVNGLFGLATNAEAQGKTDDALKYYSDVSTRYNSSYLAPMALYYHGRLTEKSGKQREALQDFEEVVRRYPQSAMAAWARKDADRLTAKLGLNVQAQPSPSASGTSVTPQASPSGTVSQGDSPQASPSAQSSATPAPTTSTTPQATATPRSTLEP
jgi:hypothetical protein